MKVSLLQCMSPELCRFSDAGNDDLTMRSGGRRPKSAKARNRAVGWCGGGGAGAMGIWSRAQARG
jgi:hypothetical protein